MEEDGVNHIIQRKRPSSEKEKKKLWKFPVILFGTKTENPNLLRFYCHAAFKRLKAPKQQFFRWSSKGF